MKKILYTFFFGYAPFRYRRLIRTPIILTLLILFGIAISEVHYDVSRLNPFNLPNNIELAFTSIFCILLGVAFISFIIEPFFRKKVK